MKKKNWFSFLMVLVMLFAMQAMFPAAKGQAEDMLLESRGTADDSTRKSGDALMKDYIRSVFYPRAKTKGSTAGNELTGRSKKVYQALIPVIQEVAAGTRSSTEFSFDASELYGQSIVTFGDLGLGHNPSGNEIMDAFVPNEAILALLFDYPYELYWFDKTGSGGWYTGISNVSVENEQINIEDATLTIKFAVAQEYAVDTYTVDTSYGQTVHNAVNCAKSIVAAHAGEDNLKKLTSYKDEICDLVEYNFAAAESSSTPYGNPWQLVWVFDGDPSTKVVCEGYSKAFQYLCDLSSFSNGVRAISVSGDMDGGPHMWNIVKMNGQNLLVDVTNTDGDGVSGYPDALFLDYASDGTYDTGYYYYGIHYVYDDETKNGYRKSDLVMAGGSDAPEDPPAQTVYTVTVTTDGNGTASADPESGTEGTEVSLTATPNEGYRLKEWQVLAGNVVISGNQFVIGTANVEIKAVFELIPSETHTLTIYYVFEDGSQAADPYTAELAEGEDYFVASPVIEGYVASQSAVSGTMDTEDITVTVVYSENLAEVHILQIDYVYEDYSDNAGGEGWTSRKTLRRIQAAESYIGEYEEGEAYSVDSPEIDGYVPDQATVSGIMGTEDITVTVVYTAQVSEEVAIIGDGIYRIDYDEEIVTFEGAAKSSITSLRIYDGIVFDDGTIFKVTTIAEGACNGLTKLAKLYIGDEVTVIGESAFNGCVSLKTVKGGAKVRTMGADTFNGCRKLTAVPAFANLKTMGNGAFRNCKALTKMVISAKVTSVGNNAFNGCVKLKTITGGKAVTKIGTGAFAGCSVLTTVPAFGKLQTIGENAFKGCKTLTKFTLSASVKSIGKNAFNSCAKLKTITVKTTKLTDKNVGAGAFKGIYKKATFKCPKAKLSAYKKLFVKKGAPKTCSFKK